MDDFELQKKAIEIIEKHGLRREMFISIHVNRWETKPHSVHAVNKVAYPIAPDTAQKIMAEFQEATGHEILI